MSNFVSSHLMGNVRERSFTETESCGKETRE